MALPVNVAANEIYRMGVFCRLPGATAANIFHIRINAAGNGTLSIQDMANNMSELFATELKPLISSQANYFGLELRQVLPLVQAPKQAQSRAGTGAGTGAAECLPPQVTGLIKLTTGLAGRGNRGRTYVPYPTETDAELEGVPTAAYVNKLQLYSVFLINNFDLDGGIAQGWTGNLVLFKRITESYVDINGAAIRTRFATQRRRGYLAGGDAQPF